MGLEKELEAIERKEGKQNRLKFLLVKELPYFTKKDEVSC